MFVYIFLQFCAEHNRAASFQVVVNCLPYGLPDQPDAFGALDVQELLRVLAGKGYLILGAPEAEFERRNYLKELMSYSEERNNKNNNNSASTDKSIVGLGSLLSVQQVGVPLLELIDQLEGLDEAVKDNVQNATTSSDVSHTDEIASSPKETVDYTIAVFRKQ